MRFTNFLKTLGDKSICILDDTIPSHEYIPIDFSTENNALEIIDLAHPKECQDYITRILKGQNATVAYGGYLEKRNLYHRNPYFHMVGMPLRNIHLGIDFWARAGTKVLVPIDGTVHSFKNNDMTGDYGPTIILRHEFHRFSFHTLYGHLSVASLANLFIGKKFKKGEVLATLGTTEINVNYAPHLHFQLIIDMEDEKGDYPGVCAEQDLEFFSKNCPDPNLILRLP